MVTFLFCIGTSKTYLSLELSNHNIHVSMGRNAPAEEIIIKIK